MTPGSIRSALRRAVTGAVAVLLAVLVGACGDPDTPEPSRAGPPPADRSRDAPRPPAPTPLPPVASLASDYLPPPSVRAPERTDPAVEACVERNLHDERYESLGKRDARRKLRRLEVKAACEQQVAAR
ncbi:MAG: hypothetical protein WB493_18065 [Anaeromyxobacteraceae bacterium]